jgi:hypothetical protein
VFSFRHFASVSLFVDMMNYSHVIDRKFASTVSLCNTSGSSMNPPMINNKPIVRSALMCSHNAHPTTCTVSTPSTSSSTATPVVHSRPSSSDTSQFDQGYIHLTTQQISSNASENVLNCSSSAGHEQHLLAASRVTTDRQSPIKLPASVAQYSATAYSDSTYRQLLTQHQSAANPLLTVRNTAATASASSFPIKGKLNSSSYTNANQMLLGDTSTVFAPMINADFHSLPSNATSLSTTAASPTVANLDYYHHPIAHYPTTSCASESTGHLYSPSLNHYHHHHPHLLCPTVGSVKSFHSNVAPNNCSNVAQAQPTNALSSSVLPPTASLNSLLHSNDPMAPFALNPSVIPQLMQVNGHYQMAYHHMMMNGNNASTVNHPNLSGMYIPNAHYFANGNMMSSALDVSNPMLTLADRTSNQQLIWRPNEEHSAFTACNPHVRPANSSRQVRTKKNDKAVRLLKPN